MNGIYVDENINNGNHSGRADAVFGNESVFTLDEGIQCYLTKFNNGFEIITTMGYPEGSQFSYDLDSVPPIDFTIGDRTFQYGPSYYVSEFAKALDHAGDLYAYLGEQPDPHAAIAAANDLYVCGVLTLAEKFHPASVDLDTIRPATPTDIVILDDLVFPAFPGLNVYAINGITIPESIEVVSNTPIGSEGLKFVVPTSDFFLSCYKFKGDLSV